MTNYTKDVKKCLEHVSLSSQASAFLKSAYISRSSVPHVCRSCDCPDVTGVSFHKPAGRDAIIDKERYQKWKEFHPKWEFHQQSFTDQCKRLVGTKCSTGFLVIILAVETCSGANPPTPRQPNPFWLWMTAIDLFGLSVSVKIGNN